MSTKALVASSKWSYEFNIFFLRKGILNSENECKRCVKVPRTHICNQKSDSASANVSKCVEKVRPSDSPKQLCLSWSNKQALARLKGGKHENTDPDTNQIEHKKLLLLDVLRSLSKLNLRSSREVLDLDHELLMADVRMNGRQFKYTYLGTYTHEVDTLDKLSCREVSTSAPLAPLVYINWSTYHHELLVADVRMNERQFKNTYLYTHSHEFDKLSFREVFTLAPSVYTIWSTCHELLVGPNVRLKNTYFDTYYPGHDKLPHREE